MDTEEFIKICREKLKEYVDVETYKISDSDIKLVWYSKTLQNNKAVLFIPKILKAYFEFTYNGNKKELYLDVYNKLLNKCYKIEEVK